MRILVVGMGSIGTRRAKALERHGHYVAGVDHKRERAEFRHVSEAAQACRRVTVLEELFAAGIKYVFIEKPLAVSYEELGKVMAVGSAFRACCVACNMRFDERFVDLRNMVPASSDMKAVLTMGQHEKHWSPEHTALPMLLDSIHELDLAVQLSGPIVLFAPLAWTTSTSASL